MSRRRRLTGRTFRGTPHNEEQLIVSADTPVSGSYKVVFDGQTTAAINWNDDQATVLGKIAALSNVGVGNVEFVTFTTTVSIHLRFIGSLGGTDLPLITITENTVKKAGNIAVSINTAVQVEGGIY